MEPGNLMIGMVSLLVAVVLGYLIGSWTAPDDTSVDATGRRGTPPERERSRMDRAQLEEHVAFLEGELALQRLRKQTLEDELYGEPIQWPEDVPRQYDPGRFRDNVRQAVEDCAPDVEVVGFDCSEPPCLVHLRGGGDGWGDRLINGCPAWVDPYGSGASTASGTVDCGGGTEERYQIVGPHREQPWGDGPDAGENQRKRWEQRVEQARFDWECAGAV
jgi:hypothetical protein